MTNESFKVSSKPNGCFPQRIPATVGDLSFSAEVCPVWRCQFTSDTLLQITNHQFLNTLTQKHDYSIAVYPVHSYIRTNAHTHMPAYTLWYRLHMYVPTCALENCMPAYMYVGSYECQWITFWTHIHTYVLSSTQGSQPLKWVRLQKLITNLTSTNNLAPDPRI